MRAEIIRVPATERDRWRTPQAPAFWSERFAVVYFCLIETGGPTASHLEILEAECAQAATSEAKRLMARHASAVMAHVIHGDETVASIPAAIATAGFEGAGGSDSGV